MSGQRGESREGGHVERLPRGVVFLHSNAQQGGAPGIMACHGTCVRHQAGKPGRQSRYEAGQVRCQQCNIWMVREEPGCPCCGLKLRRNARRH